MKTLFSPCLFTSNYSIALAQAPQFPVDKAGRSPSPWGLGEATAHSGLTQRRFLSPSQEPGCGSRERPERGEVGGPERSFNDSPKVAEEGRLWQLQVPRGQRLPVETDRIPLGAPAASPGEQGYHKAPRETTCLVSGVWKGQNRPSPAEMIKPYDVNLTLPWLFCVRAAQQQRCSWIHSLDWHVFSSGPPTC